MREYEILVSKIAKDEIKKRPKGLPDELVELGFAYKLYTRGFEPYESAVIMYRVATKDMTFTEAYDKVTQELVIRERQRSGKPSKIVYPAFGIGVIGEEVPTKEEKKSEVKPNSEEKERS